MKKTGNAPAMSRHLRWETFESRIRAGLPSLEAISGSPRTVFFIEPNGARIGLRISAKTDALPPSPLAEIDIRLVGRGKASALELSTANTDLFRDFYSLSCALADRVQIDHQPANLALTDTLKAWASLIRRKALLSEEKQIGLVGELLFLRLLAKKTSWVDAVSAWHGPQAEEHDFSLPRVDVEVKTTRNEQRIHQIGTMTQLLPKLNRPLVLVSVQVTLGAATPDSLSLARLVASILVAAGPSASDSVRERLEQVGWRDEDAQHYAQSYYLRGPLVAVPVNEGFPAIVPATLSALGAAGLERIKGLSYWVSVDGLGAIEGSGTFKNLLFPKRSLS